MLKKLIKKLRYGKRFELIKGRPQGTPLSSVFGEDFKKHILKEIKCAKKTVESGLIFKNKIEYHEDKIDEFVYLIRIIKPKKDME